MTFDFFLFLFFFFKATKAVFQGQMQVLPLKVCLVQSWAVQAEPTWKILHNQWEKRMRVYACCTASKLILLTQIVFPARSTTQNFIKATYNNSVMQETELLCFDNGSKPTTEFRIKLNEINFSSIIFGVDFFFLNTV